MLNISVDHFLLATPDLDQGCEFAERLLGTAPVIGGVHPGMGTRNALLGLHGDIYIEVIAPDPQQPLDLPLSRYLGALKEPGLRWWAARCDDLNALETRLRRLEVNITGVQPGSRTLPDGRDLAWRTLMADAPDLDSALPFFISWQDPALHPAKTLPIVGDLTSCRIIHPAANKLRSILGDEFEVHEGDKAQMRLQISNGNGIVSLNTPRDIPPAIGSIL